MLPRWHILTGAIFTALIWFFAPETPFVFLALVFLSSFLIDFDHYLVFVRNFGKFSLMDAFEYHELEGIKERKEIARGIRRKSDFHIFHTIEFHALIGVLSLFFFSFFYIFLGMVFHSLLDVFSMIRDGALHRREFFFFNWLARRV